jgi:hypothetical protein
MANLRSRLSPASITGRVPSRHKPTRSPTVSSRASLQPRNERPRPPGAGRTNPELRRTQRDASKYYEASFLGNNSCQCKKSAAIGNPAHRCPFATCLLNRRSGNFKPDSVPSGALEIAYRCVMDAVLDWRSPDEQFPVEDDKISRHGGVMPRGPLRDRPQPSFVHRRGRREPPGICDEGHCNGSSDAPGGCKALVLSEPFRQAGGADQCKTYCTAGPSTPPVIPCKTSARATSGKLDQSQRIRTLSATATTPASVSPARYLRARRQAPDSAAYA